MANSMKVYLYSNDAFQVILNDSEDTLLLFSLLVGYIVFSVYVNVFLLSP